MDANGYYAALEVPRDATRDNIKHAYKRLAIRHHPDKGGDAEAFKRVAEAYDVLSDEQKRAAYDRGACHPWRSAGCAGGGYYARGREKAFDPHEIFRQFFGGAGVGGGPFDLGLGGRVFTFSDPGAAAAAGGGMQMFQSESVRVVGNMRISKRVEVCNGVRRETVTETDMATGSTSTSTSTSTSITGEGGGGRKPGEHSVQFTLG